MKVILIDTRQIKKCLLLYVTIFICLPFQGCNGSTKSSKLLSALLELDMTLEEYNIQLVENNKNYIGQLQEKAIKNPNYTPLLLTANRIQSKFAVLYERLKIQQDSLTKKQELSSFSQEELLANRKKNNWPKRPFKELKVFCLENIASLWDNNSLIGTIFNDPNKKDGLLKELEGQIPITKNDGLFSSEISLIDQVLLLKKLQKKLLLTETIFYKFLIKTGSHLGSYYNRFDAVNLSPSIVPFGKTYKAEIALVQYGSFAKYELFIDEKHLKAIDGVAEYEIKPKSIGKKEFTAKIKMLDPYTGDTVKFSKEFFYHVIE